MLTNLRIGIILQQNKMKIQEKVRLPNIHTFPLGVLSSTGYI
jgi:hypothetical protein